MILDTCSWGTPGAFPYTGSLAAHVQTMDIPEPHKGILIAKVKALKDFETVKITKTGIDGVMPTFMPFGSKGKVCKTVTMTSWGPKIFQPAMLFRSGPYAVGVPPVCRNVSLFIFKEPPNEPPVPPEPPAFPPGPPDGYVPPDSPPASPPNSEVPPRLTFTPPDDGRGGLPPGGWYPTVTCFACGYGTVPSPGPQQNWYIISTIPMPGLRSVVPGIPEPETWLMMLAGLAALVFKIRKP